MKGVFVFLRRAVPFLLLIAVFVAVICYPRADAEESGAIRVLQVWNVDTFEGGKGSRTSFLKRAAAFAEREREDVRYLVKSVTREGALDALSRGELPDVLSFGTGLAEFAEFCLPLGERFAGDDRALPWCRGQYYLFSHTDDFDAEGKTAVSVGGNNLPSVAAYFADVQGEEIASLSAYVDFLGGDYRYLLGTQRDKCRFAARGASVCERALSSFCDLYEYVAVLSRENYDDAIFFVQTLRSDAVQCQLSDIGMLTYAGAEGLTTGAFAEEGTLSALLAAVRAGAPRKNIENFLKTV